MESKTEEEETTPSRPLFVTQLCANDVLLGRGAPSIDNEGNVRFRKLVQTRKPEYVSTGKRQTKDWIAKQVIHAVRKNGGNFLRKIESLVEAEKLGVQEGVTAWTLVDDSLILQKVKQALRDKEPGGKQAQSEQTNNTAMNASPKVPSPTVQGKELFKPFEGRGPPIQPGVVVHDSTRFSSLNPALSDVVIPPQQSLSMPGPFSGRQSIVDPLVAKDYLPPSINTAVGLANLRGRKTVPGIATNLLAGGSPTTLSLYERSTSEHSRFASSSFGKSYLTENIKSSGTTKAESVLEAAIDEEVLDKPSDDMLSLSIVEWLILKTISSCGIPLWPMYRLEEAFHKHTHGNNMTWPRIGSTLLQVTQSWAQQCRLASVSARRLKVLLIAEHLSLFFAREVEELARKTICLLERLYESIATGKVASYKQDGSSVGTWFGQHLSLWGVALGINSSSSGRPVSYTTSNFRISFPELATNEAFMEVAKVDASGAMAIWDQVSILSRLRHIFVGTSVSEIFKLLEDVEGSIDEGSWKTRPAWWDPSDVAALVLQRDCLLLERTLHTGYNDIIFDLRDKLPPGLTREAVQDRVSMLTRELHERIVATERQLVLGRRATVHLASIRGIAGVVGLDISLGTLGSEDLPAQKRARTDRID